MAAMTMHRTLATMSIKTRVLWNFQTTRPREAFSGPTFSTSSSQRIRNLGGKKRKKERDLHFHWLFETTPMDTLCKGASHHPPPGSGGFRQAALIFPCSFICGWDTEGAGSKALTQHRLVSGVWALPSLAFPAPAAHLWHNTSYGKRQRQRKNQEGHLVRAGLKEGQCDRRVW